MNPETSMKSLLARIATIFCILLSAVPGHAQLARQWVTVAASDGSVIGQVPAIGRLVEPNPGNRAALISMSTATSTTMIFSAGGGLRKVIYTAGNPVPTFSTPAISLSTNEIPRTILRTPSGTLYMVANTGIDATWPTNTTVMVGHLYASLDNGDTWTQVKAVNTAGYIAAYMKVQTGSSDNAAIRVGGIDVVSYEVMEFEGAGASANAAAYATAGTVHVTGGSRDVYYGFKAIADGAGATEGGGSFMTRIGEIPVSATGADLGFSAIRYRYKTWGAYCNNDAGYVEGRATPLFSNWLSYSARYVTGNDGNCGLASGSQTGTNDVSMSLDCAGNHQTCFSDFPQGYYKGNNFAWTDGPHDVARFRAAVVTPDNSGLVLSGYDQNGTGALVWRGAFGSGGAAPATAMNGGAYLSNPQEVFAGYNQFLAVVADSGGGVPSIYMTDTTVPAQGGSVLTQTTFGNSSTDRVAIASPASLNWTSSGADISAWSGKLLAVAQDRWSSGSPSVTRFGLFVVPTTVTVNATVGGTSQPGPALTGCSIALTPTITGEPNATVYYVWQKQNADSSWPSTANLNSFSVTSLDATGNVTLPAYTPPSNGNFRLVAAGQIGGFVYDQTAAGFGTPSTVYGITYSAVPSMGTPQILNGATVVGTTSATVCAGTTLTLQVAVTNGDSNAIVWNSGGTQVGSGPTLTVTPAANSTITAVYTGTSCVAVPSIDFSITATPATGTLSVSRTVTTVSGSTLQGSAVVDTAAGCPGNAVTFAGAAANADTYLLDRGAGVNAHAIGAGNTWTVPRLAASLSLSQNPSFESGATGWDLPLGWNVQSMASAGGAADGTYAVVGINSPGAIVSHSPILVDSTANYYFFAAGKSVFPSSTRNIRLYLDCYGADKVTAIGGIAVSNDLLTSSWHSYGGMVGPNGIPFLAGTVYVKLRVQMPDGQEYLDAIRLVQVDASQYQMGGVFATQQYGGSLTSMWDDVVGYDTGNPVTNIYRMTASQVSGCGTSTVQNLQVVTYPRLVFSGYQAVVGAMDYLVPDPNPAKPMKVSVCEQAGSVSLTANASDGSVSTQWYMATDAPNFQSWSAIPGATGGTYFYTVPVGGGEAQFKVIAAGSGCDFTTVTSRVFDVVTAPAPTATLSGPASACSGGTVAFTAAIANGTPLWEMSVDGGSTWSPFIPASLGGNNYTVAAPTVPGPSSVTVRYRLSVTSAGCSTIYANGSTNGIAVSVVPPVTLSNSSISATGFTATSSTAITVCAGTTVTCTLNATNGDVNQITWWDGGTQVGFGNSLVFSPSVSTTVEARYPATICGTPAPVDFSVTVNPALGSLSVSRTVTTVSGSTLQGSAVVDTAAGCPGNAVAFAGTAANADTYLLDRGAGIDAHAIGAGNTWTVPRLAASLSLSQNPGFESGATGWDLPLGWNVQSMASAGGAADGTYAVVGINSPGAIVSHSPILVDSTANYYFFAAGKSVFPSSTRNIRLYLDCYGADKVTAIGGIAVSNDLLTSSWHSYGGMVGPNGIPFLAGTVYVKLRVQMPDGQEYLDAIRLVQVDASQYQMGGVFATQQYGGSLTSMWDDVVGYDTGNPVTNIYRMTASQVSGCGTSTVQNLQVVTYPRLVFSGYQAVVGAMDYLVPDPNPAKPMKVSVCEQAGSVSLTANASDGSVSTQWYMATDAPNFQSWSAIPGATGGTYFYTVPVGGGEAQFKVIAAGSGCDFTTVTSRVFDVVTAPAPTATLSGPASACSGGTVAFTAAIANGTPLWEMSVDGGSTWSPFIPASLGGNNYSTTAPTVSGTNPTTVRYRLSVTSAGCSTIYANGSTTGIAVSVAPPTVFGATSINGQPSLSATICPGDLVNLDSGVVAPAGATFQWYTRPNVSSAWSLVSGATSATYTFNAPSSTTASSAQFMISVTSGCGGTADTSASPFTLFYNSSISVSSQPIAPAATCSGTQQSLTFGAPGSQTISWTESGYAPTDYILSGLTGSTITVPALASGPALNPDPSFELGVDNSVLQRIAGATGSSVGWDRTDVAYHGNAAAKTVGGDITLLHPSTVIPIDTTRAYLVIAAIHAGGTRTHSLGVRPYDSTGAALGPDIWIPGATSVIAGSTDYKAIGGFINAGGTSPTLPAGTAGVKLLVRLNAGGTTEDGFLDDLRIVPVDGSEMAILGNLPSGITMPEYWDGRAGRDASGTAQRSFNYTATAVSACGSVTSNSVTVNAIPKPYIAQQPAATTTLCSGASTTLNTVVIGGGTQTLTWQQSSDGGQTWTVIANQNANSYTYQAPVVQASMTMQFRMLIISSCGTFVTNVSSVTVNPTPAIQTDLSTQTTACSGDTISATFAATGGVMNWQASLDGGPWSAVSATSSGSNLWTLTLPTVTGNLAKNYSLRVTVSSGLGCASVISQIQTITIRPVTAILTQPQSLVSCLTGGSYPSMSAAVDGTNLVYQWQTNDGTGWVNVPGGNGYTYTPTVPNGTTTDYTLQVRLNVSGDCGAVTSNMVTATFYAPPTITTQPQSSSIASGQMAVLFVQATGTSNTYQWQTSDDGNTWSPLAGATSPGLNLPNQTASGLSTTVHFYRVVISGVGCAPVVSNSAKVTVYPAPSVLAVAPTSATCSGQSAQLSETTTAGVNLTYQWQAQVFGVWTDIQGATGTSFSEAMVSTGNIPVVKYYRVVATDPLGQTAASASVQVVWNPPTVITTQPVGATIATGQSASLSTVATGYGLSFQWEVSPDGASWSQVNGGTSASLNTGALVATGVQTTSYYYRVTVSGTTCNPVVSSVAVVTVYPAPSASPVLQSANPACSGTPIQMAAGVTSGVGLTVKWQTDQSGTWADIPGATSVSYSASADVLGNVSVARNFRVVVTDPLGQTFTSGAVTATWNPATAILSQTAQPSLACSGVTQTLNLNATGATSIQWVEASSDNGPVITYPAGASISAPVLASGPALNPDPSFEAGTAELERTGGSTGSSVKLDGTNPAYFGNQSIQTAGGDIVLRTPVSGFVSVDTSRSYMLIAAVKGAAILPARVGFEAFDAANNSLGVFWVATGNASPTTWTPLGAIVNRGGGTTPFPAGTTAVKLVAELNQTGIVETGGLDDFRLIPLSANEAAIASSPAAGYTVASWWDARAGRDASGQVTRVFTYTPTVTGACGVVTGQPVTLSAAAATVFASQPQDVNVCSGGSQTFSASVYGGGTLSYTWQTSPDKVTWAAVAGANSPTWVYTAPTVTSTQTTYIRLQVIGVCGILTSRVATVTVSTSAKIITQPSSTSIAAGQSANLSVAASGGTGLTYQWEQSFDGSSWNQVVGATGASLNTGALAATGVQTASYFYRVTVSGPTCSPIVSAVAQITVYPNPVVAAVADGSNVSCTGTSVTVRAQITAGVNLTYQWQVLTSGVWVPISGATGSSTALIRTAYGTTPTQVQVQAVGVDAIGQTYTSAPETVTWNPLPVITTQPLSTTICQGQNVTVTAAFSGQAGTTGQWQFSPDGSSWNDIPGATSGSLSQAALQATTFYRMRVSSSGCGDVFTAVSTVTVTPNVTITGQPQGGTICSGDQITLTVRANGANLSYRWEKNLSGTWQSVQGNAASITIPMTNLGSSDQTVLFRVTVSGDCGADITSSLATVVVKPGFQILTQPQSVSICNNQNAVLAFTLNGQVSSIAWQTSVDGGASWTAVPGATGTGLNTGILTSGNYLYRAQINGICGAPVFTDAATVSVAPVPVITNQPVDVTTCNGQGASFSITTNVPSTYQWYSSPTSNGTFVPVQGQTGSTLTLTNLTNLSGAQTSQYYKVVATPVTCGQPVTSNVVALMIRPGTAVVAQPANVDTCVNNPASVSVTVTGESATTTWQMSTDGVAWSPIPGATGTSVQVPTNVIGSYQVRAVVSGGCGIVTSNPATVKVSGPTQITTQPTAGTACEGNSVTLSVAANGAALTYRWEQSQDNGRTWTTVGGSSPSLTVIASRTTLYRVTVFGGGGCNDTVVSQVATMTVNRVPQDVPLETPTYASAGRQVYLQVSDSGPAYDKVTWTLGSQTATGRSVVLQVPAEPGNYTVTVVATLGPCQSVTAWTLGAVSKGNGDINQSGVIDGDDFARMQVFYGTKAGDRGFDAALDLNGDGVIDALDQALLVAGYGNSVAGQVASISSSDVMPGTWDEDGKVAILPANYSWSIEDEFKRKRNAA
jgi:hypothetical protein